MNDRRDRIINAMIRSPQSALSRMRVLRLRLMGAQIGARCWLRRISVPRNPWDIGLGCGVALDDGVVLLTTGSRTGRPRISIGDGTYINRYTMIDASETIRIGPGSMIGPFAYLTDHDHGRSPGEPIGAQPLVGAPVVVGRNVWIGAGATILKGVTVGDDAVIGAGAVVTRDVAAGATVGGVPARSIS